MIPHCSHDRYREQEGDKQHLHQTDRDQQRQITDHGSGNSSRPHEPSTPPRPAPTPRNICKGGPRNVCTTATYLRETLDTSEGTMDACYRQSDGGGGDGDGRGWGGGVRSNG